MSVASCLCRADTLPICSRMIFTWCAYSVHRKKHTHTHNVWSTRKKKNHKILLSTLSVIQKYFHFPRCSWGKKIFHANSIGAWIWKFGFFPFRVFSKWHFYFIFCIFFSKKKKNYSNHVVLVSPSLREGKYCWVMWGKKTVRTLECIFPFVFFFFNWHFYFILCSFRNWFSVFLSQKIIQMTGFCLFKPSHFV